MKTQKLNETQYLHQNRKGNYKIIYPIRDPETKKIIKRNVFGSPKKLILIGLFILWVIFVAWAYNHDVESCEALWEDPCALYINLSKQCSGQPFQAETISSTKRLGVIEDNDNWG